LRKVAEIAKRQMQQMQQKNHFSVSRNLDKITEKDRNK